MSTYEVISTVALVLTSIIAIAAIVVPVIINHHTAKIHLKEREMEAFNQTIHERISEFLVTFGNWRNDVERGYVDSRLTDSASGAIYKLMYFCKDETYERLFDLSKKINKTPLDTVHIDRNFRYCVELLRKDFNLNK